VNFGVREPNLGSYVGDAAVNIAELGEVQQADSMLGIVECKRLHNFKIRHCAARLKGRSYRGGVDGNSTAVQAVREFPVAKLRLALLTRIKKGPDPACSCNVSNRWDAAVGDSLFMVGVRSCSLARYLRCTRLKSSLFSRPLGGEYMTIAHFELNG
jgi:hypothetical protein